MVHTGKPSRGCAACRRRRIKCDEAVPECSYCVKKRKPCSGYKDPFDLALRDQTKTAERSVQRRKRAYEDVRQPMEYSSEELVRIPTPLREYQKDHALCFFFTEYVLIPRDPQSIRGYMEYVTPVFVKCDTQSPVVFATQAVAICLLEAWLNKGPDTLLSRASYLMAITAVRERVEQRKSCDVEELLLAILLLDMYEGLVTTAKSQQGTGTHISGAVALIKHRRANTFQTENSQRLLLAVRSKLIENAMQTLQPLPQDMTTWSEIARDLPWNAALSLDDMNIDVANLQTIASKTLQLAAFGHTDSATEVQQTIENAIKIDKRLASWPDSLPPSWQVRRIYSPELIPQQVRDTGFYQRQCDIYSNIFSSSTWNSYRVSRLKVQTVILACLAQLPVNYDPKLFSTARNVIQEMADDICASVPFHLGDKTKPVRLDNKHVHFPQLPGAPLPKNHYRVAAAVGGFYMLSALYGAINPQLPLRAGQRVWIMGQLRRAMTIYNTQR